MDVKFWSIKCHIEHWKMLNDVENIYIDSAEPGSKIARIWLLGDMTGKEFIKKYEKLETAYFIGFLTKDEYPKIVHVSFKRKK